MHSLVHWKRTKSQNRKKAARTTRNLIKMTNTRSVVLVQEIAITQDVKSLSAKTDPENLAVGASNANTKQNHERRTDR